MSDIFALRRYAFSRTISLVHGRHLYIIVKRASDCFPPLGVQSLAHGYLSEGSPSVRHADELEFSVHRLDVSEVTFDREVDKEVKAIHQREALRAGCFILFFSLLFHICISYFFLLICMVVLMILPLCVLLRSFLFIPSKENFFV